MPADFERYLEEELFRSGENDREIAAIRAIFRRYRKRMEHIVRKQLPQYELLHEDVLMETMFRIYRKRSYLLTHPEPVLWVFRVLYNVAMEKLEEERKHSMPDYDEEAASVSSDMRSDTKVRTGDTVAAIRKAMDHLRPQEYRVFEHCYFGDLGPEQIASELGIALQTVHNLLSISRKKVRAKLDRQLLNK